MNSIVIIHILNAAEMTAVTDSVGMKSKYVNCPLRDNRRDEDEWTVYTAPHECIVLVIATGACIVERSLVSLRLVL